MKKVLIALLLLPLLTSAQDRPQEPLFMNVMITPHSGHVNDFESGLAAHNKKYHAEGANAVRVYWIASGKNSGKYIWSMGPTAWGAMDEANNTDEAHTNDWNTNVAPHAETTMETTYWKGDSKHSNFTRDFELKNLSVFYLDMKRFKEQSFMGILDKVTKVFKEKDGDEQWGVYFNELRSPKYQDMVWINFFDSMSWMGEEDKFPQWYEEVHGEGTFMGFLKEFEAATNGDYQELWTYRSDLSGLSGQVVIPSGE
ncbi:hypothetical protein DKG77_09240 [Flagellimonas aquimarina]|uniref:Uncharacterized protein n=1 Tax=Flagellimonas aquimarina TaxID=2201895 RepID=A0A316LEC7_9FLAO|nr:hypothetical protein [Allomuricauda koreensis]PWL38440.1 hypothetical protein DKG77_09240 [Allomuricauda koreensis]